MGQWKTIRGSRVYIEDGQSVSDAFKSREREFTSEQLRYEQQIDKYTRKNYKSFNHITMSDNTPENLKHVGLNDLPMTVISSKLDRIINKAGSQKRTYHGLGAEITKQLPKAIKDPRYILKADKGIIVVTQLYDKQNRPIIVPIIENGLARRGNNFYKANVITSAYGRNNFDAWLKKQKILWAK